MLTQHSAQLLPQSIIMNFQFVSVILLVLTFFQVGFSQDETPQVVTTKKTLKKLLAGEINKALDGFTCSAPESTAAPCTESPSHGRMEQAVNRIEAKLDIPTPCTETPSHGRIEQTVNRIENNLVNPTVSLTRIQETVDRMETNLPSTTISRIENRLLTLDERIESLQNQVNTLNGYGSSRDHAASSCADIITRRANAPSGYYWVNNTAGQPHRVHCDMTRSCGGVTGGWMRVAYLDMTNSNERCPSGLTQLTHERRRLCAAAAYSATCSNVYYSVNNFRYTKVCGRVRGYYGGTLDGFDDRSTNPSIDSNYVDGISLTHGRPPRRHIWTFTSNKICYCGPVPRYVGNDRFCDIGLRSTSNFHNPLWDGENCGSNECCIRNNPPWFYKELAASTADDLEMRVCRDEDRNNEDTLIEALEFYVQ